jgi:hypothetical protein
LVAILLAAGAAWVAPLLLIVSRPIRVAGFPLVFVYLFASWALMILLVARVLRPDREE